MLFLLYSSFAAPSAGTNKTSIADQEHNSIGHPGIVLNGEEQGKAQWKCRHRLRKRADGYDAWLNGYDTNVIDGDSTGSPCQVIPVTINPPATPKPTTVQSTKAGRASLPTPHLPPQVTDRPRAPYGGYVIFPYNPANGRPAVYRYDTTNGLVPLQGVYPSNRLVPANGVIPTFGRVLTVGILPGGAKIPAGRFVPNTGVVPSSRVIPVVPLAPKTQTPINGHSPGRRPCVRTGLVPSQQVIGTQGATNQFYPANRLVPINKLALQSRFLSSNSLGGNVGLVRGLGRVLGSGSSEEGKRRKREADPEDSSVVSDKEAFSLSRSIRELVAGRGGETNPAAVKTVKS
nr:PREDICTED: uncharacterized protein LOC107077166 [Lepisosteus oculatus]